MKIGLVQTGAIGDIVIALPIACYYLNQGHEVYWPIDKRFVVFFSEAEPRVTFIPVDSDRGTNTLEYFLQDPYAYLGKVGCDKMFTLYSYLTGINLGHPRLSWSLKFDEYKYAVAGVPFEEKWNLKIVRNFDREQMLREMLNLKKDYVVIHEEGGVGSNFKLEIKIPDDIADTHQIIRIQPLTSSPFDWITIFEGAKQVAMIDCLHANIIEQLRIPVQKTLYLRVPINTTPVYASGWKFK